MRQAETMRRPKWINSNKGLVAPCATMMVTITITIEPTIETTNDCTAFAPHLARSDYDIEHVPFLFEQLYDISAVWFVCSY